MRKALVLAVALLVLAPAAHAAPAGRSPTARAAEEKLGLVEARVKIWRMVQRYMSRERGEPVFEWSDSFSCQRVSRWRVRCWFSFETASHSYSGHGYIRKWPGGYWQGWWKAQVVWD